jgi:translation elongation factor EF-Ts
MSGAKKSLSERAMDRLEEKGYLKKIRAEMKANIMDCLVEMEESGEIPSAVRIKRYTPADEDDQEAIKAIYQFLVQHKLDFTANCLLKEVNWDIPEVVRNEEYSDLADRILAEAPEDLAEAE